MTSLASDWKHSPDPPIDCRKQAITLKCPAQGQMSVMGIYRQLGRRTLRIQPFQQKRDADADENERPDPTDVDVDHAHAREQEHDATDQK